jgi:plastocyanin
MRKISVFIMILVLLFAFGCAKKVEPISPPAPAPVPVVTQVNPGVEQPATQPPVAEPEKPVEQKTIGTRVEGTEKPAEEQAVPEDVEAILITAEKKMTSGDVAVAKGTTLFWQNTDTWPHQLKITTGSSYDTKLHAESPRLLEGNVWNYTFAESGVFTVRDIFSGGIRMIVTVE